MTSGGYRQDAKSLAELRSADLGRAGIVFTDEYAVYRTTGQHFAKGGMGDLFLLHRLDPATGAQEECVGKVFQRSYLHQLRTDEVTRTDYDRNVRAVARIASLDHPNLLPTYISSAIADNHLTVAPRVGKHLATHVTDEDLSVRDRVALLLDALTGLAALHDAGVLHRDFTLRNVIANRDGTRAMVFDFDLALCIDEVAGESYEQHYRGRIFGSPGYSVPPEILDAQLMRHTFGESLDLYAIGGALFNLFTDALPYGETEDMWGLYLRIADGIVCNGESRITYPNEVPRPLRPVIERCLEREPADRYESVAATAAAIEAVMERLPDRIASQPGYRNTLRYGHASLDPPARLKEVYDARRDDSITLKHIEIADSALSKLGYQVQRSLGRAKRYPIFVAAPEPLLLASGEFPDANTYPKIVTAVDLAAVDDAERFVDLWLGGYLPILRSVRTGMLTALFRVVHDADSAHLFLFSEYVDDARFGTDLGDFELSVEEALGLAYLVARQVRGLHRRGLAHNNVNAGALLLKGIRDSQRVEPAMIGLVEPSFSPAAMAGDVRNLAALALEWLRPSRVAGTEPRVRQRLAGLRSYLQGLVTTGDEPPPDAEELVSALGAGIGALDPNFSILATYGGDLPAYALLLIQHRLYTRLW